MDSGFTLAVREEKGSLIVSIRGTVDVQGTAHFDREMHALARRRPKRLIAELSQLTCACSAALGVLISMNQKLQRQGGELRIVSPSPAFEQLLRIAGLDQSFAIHTTIAEALLDRSRAE